jgi:aspartyl-tRNA(Asn)/glutamyl-tRNA(Gln) amidotransferase subunit A
MENEKLYSLSAVELSDLISGKEISPVDIVNALLERIDDVNDHIKAFIHICREEALADARQAEAELRNGDSKGPLHGIPVAYKDIYDVRGLPTTGGSIVMKGYTAKKDSAMAANLRKAGTICMGKLNTWEFASGGMELIGDARNPWNTRMITGGSSAGPGAAVAASLVPLATGSDTGGSVRDPSALCGIVGLKPTFGRLSCEGIIPLSWSLDHPGPMTRTVADAARLFYGMSGEAMPDSVSAFFKESEGSLKNIRIGIPNHYFFDHADAEVVSAVKAAVLFMEEMGASVEEIELPFVESGPAASYTVAYTESFAFHRENFFRHAGDYTLGFISKISGAAFLSALDHLTAERIRQLVTQSFKAALSRVDMIVTPMTAFPAHPIGSTPPQSHVRSFARPISLTGLPALSMPCGFTSTELPIGMQMIARDNDENLLFRTGHAYEQSTGWHRRKPAITAAALWSPPDPNEPRAEGIDTQWVLDAAAHKGLTYIDAPMAGAIVPHVASVKAMLAEARNRLMKTSPEKLWKKYLSR